MKNFIFLSIVMASFLTQAKPEQNITLESNESVYIINGAKTTKINCINSSGGPPRDPESNSCKIIPIWKNGAFFSFQLMLEEDVWAEFSLVEFGNNKMLALKRARQEMARLVNENLCF